MDLAMNDSRLLQSVTECLALNYGIEGELSRLPGENLNFLVATARGEKFVSKIVDEHMPPDVVEMEFAAIEYAAKAGFQPQLPRIIENKYGNIETGIKLHINDHNRLRLIAFIEGIELSKLSDISDSLLTDLGRTLASFDVAMQAFDHPFARRNHRWNLAEAGQHEDEIRLLDDPARRELLAGSFATWHEAREKLAEVPWQFIHGDGHDENVLVEGERVTGLIDFGDCCHNPAICELAICLTYLMMRGDDPLRTAAVITAGYREVRPLAAQEMALLYPLVCARLAVSVCVANRRKVIDPGNPNWFGGEQATWRLLERLRSMGSGSFAAGLHGA
jgi:Ser/Thr protein kinase RdoA (MazF antagonist)